MKRGYVLLAIAALLLALACDGNGGGAPSVDETPAGETAPSGDISPPADETPTDDGEGDDSELTLEEYFQQIDAIGDEADKRFEALSMDLFPEEGFDSEEEEIQASRDLLDGADAINRDILDALNGIGPPAEAEFAHDEFADAVAELLEVGRSINGQLADVESVSELVKVVDESGLEAAGDQAVQACFKLQEIADSNDIEAGLDCSE